MMATVKSICIVEDDAALLASLSQLISMQPDMRTSGAFNSAEKALEEAPWPEVDVLLADIDLPGMSGVELIAKLGKLHPGLLPLAYTVYEDRDTVFAALKAGAFGYIIKGGGASDVLAALRQLMAGGAPMSPAIARKVIGVFRQDDMPETDEPLSIREKDLLRLVASGLVYKEIGEKLGISRHTVHTHIKNIYGKLHASGRSDALRIAANLGYLGQSSSSLQ